MSASAAERVRELLDTNTPFVVIERDHERIERLRHMGATLIVEGDATEDETLVAAGIEKARGLAACLSDDKANLFITVSARQLSKDLRIVSQNIETNVRTKMIKAGADSAVSPNFIGGLRLVSELIRPSVTTFLDTMLRESSGQNIRFAEVTVEAGSPLAGLTLGQARIEHDPGLPVLALRASAEADFHFEPSEGDRLTPGVVVIVMGGVAKVEALERRCKAGRS